MKILIVEDDTLKIKNIYRVLKSVKNVNEENIEHFISIHEAKKYLSTNIVDFLILDLNLPYQLDDDAKENEGIDFLNEIVNLNTFNKPKNIIILTRFENLKDKYISCANGLMFPVVLYNDSTIEWEEILRAKISYEVIIEESYKTENLKFDIAIITAVDIEFNTLKNQVVDSKELKFANDPTIYRTTSIESFNGEKISVVFAQQQEMGMSSAATLTTKLISRFNPKYIMMVGIAAGIGKDKKIGDILFATEVWDYSSGKMIEKPGNANIEFGFEPDPKHIRVDPFISELAMQDYSDVIEEIKVKWTKSNYENVKVHIGPLACGPAVISNGEYIKYRVENKSRKTIGLDMESYAIFYGCNYGLNKNIVPICIKSICDFADSSKNDKSQEYAAFTSSYFALYIIKKHLVF